MNLPDQYPEVLADLAGLVLARVQAYLPADQAEALAFALAEDVRLKYAGLLLYIPKGDAYERYHRNAAIWREFNGRNHAQLARKYQVGLSVIYDIVAAERARHQPTLF